MNKVKQIVACVMMLIATCFAQETIEKTLTITRGDNGLIELPCHGGAGYAWMVNGPLPDGFTASYSTKADSKLMGGSLLYVYTLAIDKKVVTGKYDINFKLVRPWLPDDIAQKALMHIIVT